MERFRWNVSLVIPWSIKLVPLKCSIAGGLSNGGNSYDLEPPSRSFPTASLSNVIFSYSCTAFDKISTGTVRRAIPLR